MSNLREGMQPQEGIRCFQHFGYKSKWKVHERFADYGVRILDRAEGQGQGGQYVEDAETRGDITQWCMWQRGKGGNARTIAGWAQAWPAKMAAGGGDGKTYTKSAGQVAGVVIPGQPQGQQVSKSNTSAQTPQNLLPIFDDKYKPDTRYSTVEAHPANSKMRFPLGYVGIVLNASDESTQKELFFPADGRLIAVNFAGDPSTATLVADLNDKGEIDEERMARLQSNFRVMKKVDGVHIPVRGQNAIAWNLFTSGHEDVMAGIVFDKQNGTGAFMSHWLSGPIDTGAIGDQHEVCLDADGNPINAGHISMDAYFRTPDGTYDGPLKFDGPFQGNVDAPIRTAVRFEFDNGIFHPFVGGMRMGKYRWTAKVWHDIVTQTPPPTTPTDGPPWHKHKKKKPPDVGDPWIGFPPLFPQPTDFFKWKFPPAPSSDGGSLHDRVINGTGEALKKVQDQMDRFIENERRRKEGLPPLGPMDPLPGHEPPAPGSSNSAKDQVERIKQKEEQRRRDEEEARRKAAETPSGAGDDTPKVGSLAFGAKDGFLATPIQSAFQTILGRPQSLFRGATDFRGWASPTPEEIADMNAVTPIVSQIVAYGAQGAQTLTNPVDGGSKSAPYAYTVKPKQGRFAGGTCPGGWALLCPEMTLEEALSTGFAPKDKTLSPLYFVATPGTYLAVGSPNLGSGGIYTGWRWGQASSGSLTFEKIDSSGALSDTIILDYGRWTPTVTALVNVTSVSASQGQWSRVGNTVTCSVIVAVDPTAAGAASVSISLPVASNIGAVGDVTGKGATPDYAGGSGGVYGSAAGDYAVLGFVAVVTSLNQSNWCLDFSYSVI